MNLTSQDPLPELKDLELDLLLDGERTDDLETLSVADWSDVEDPCVGNIYMEEDTVFSADDDFEGISVGDCTPPSFAELSPSLVEDDECTFGAGESHSFLNLGLAPVSEDYGKMPDCNSECSVTPDTNVAGSQDVTSNSNTRHLCTVNPENITEDLQCKEKSFNCMICSKKFKKKSSLKQHTLTHTITKTFTCTTCSIKFGSSVLLKQHALMHTGDKPFVCNVCDATFRHACTLKRHSLIHTGEKPYCCGSCPARFKHSATLETHLELHKVDFSSSTMVLS